MPNEQLTGLARRYVAAYDQQKALFAECTEITDQIGKMVEAGLAKVGDIIDISGKEFAIVDNFAAGNTQWRPAPIRRFDVAVVSKTRKK